MLSISHEEDLISNIVIILYYVDWTVGKYCQLQKWSIIMLAILITMQMPVVQLCLHDLYNMFLSKNSGLAVDQATRSAYLWPCLEPSSWVSFSDIHVGLICQWQTDDNSH